MPARSSYFRLAAVSRAANSGDWIDVACGPSSVFLASSCSSTSSDPGLAVARMVALVANTTSRGAAAGPRCQFQSRRHRVVGDAERQAMLHSGFGVEAHAEQQGSPRHLRSDPTLQHPRRPAARVDSELLKTAVEQCVWACDPNIGGQRQIQPRADGGAVDGSDRGQRAFADGHEPVV